MTLFDTILERYRRHRAIHKYDRKFSFWLIDSTIFLAKSVLLGFALLALVHYAPKAPELLAEQIAAWRGQPVERSDDIAESKPVIDLNGVTTHRPEPAGEAIIPASLAPVPIPHPRPSLMVVTIDVERANLREGPTTRSAVLGQLPRGSKITLFDMSGNWAQVATNDELGVKGFVHLSLLKESERQLRRQLISP